MPSNTIRLKTMNDTHSPLVEKFHQLVELVMLPLTLLLLPIRGFIITVVIFILIDTMTGVWKALITKRQDPDNPENQKSIFSSRGASEIIPKGILYAALILAFYLIDIYIITATIWGQEFLITKLITLILAGIEIKSIDENLEEIFGIGIFEGLSNLFKGARGLISRLQEIKDDFMKLKK